MWYLHDTRHLERLSHSWTQNSLWEQHFQRYLNLHFTSEILSRWLFSLSVCKCYLFWHILKALVWVDVQHYLVLYRNFTIVVHWYRKQAVIMNLNQMRLFAIVGKLRRITTELHERLRLNFYRTPTTTSFRA